MKQHRNARGRTTLAALAASALGVLALGPGAAQAAPAAGPFAQPAHSGIDMLAQRGFGDRRNSYSWSSAWFRGKLYVGTARSEACVELATIDFYFPFLERYGPHPAPNVRCPADRWDMDLRAEIWEYTPRTRSWLRVYRSPDDIPNPVAPGKRIARDIAFRGMVVHRDRKGETALYVGGVTANEFVPQIAAAHPPRLLRTVDGRRFRNIGAPEIVRRRGQFTDHVPIGFRAMTSWRGRLYVTGTPGLTGDGAVFEVKAPWAERARFAQVTPPEMHVFEMEVFDDHLYIGAGDNRSGYSVWKAAGPTRPFALRPIVTSGAGRGVSIVSVVSMHAFEDRLYVGSNGWFKRDEVPASELIRIAPDGRWALVAGKTRTVAGVVKAPISGLGDGFDNLFNAHFWRMGVNDGALYVGTNDWSWLVQTNKDWAWAQSALTGELGFDVWGSCDGRDWFPVTRDAYGRSMYDFGARTMQAGDVGLFVGSANHAEGTTVWNDHHRVCSSGVTKPARRKAARRKATRHKAARRKAARRKAARRRARTAALPPRAVMTDAQRAGTVVSWARPAAAEGLRYRVLRASYRTLPVSFVPPPSPPGGFGFEGELPLPAAPGASDSATVELPVRGPFRPIGATDAGFLVDSSRDPGRRYAYQVISEAPSGAVSSPSNVQVVPDPRPPVTFGAVERAVGSGSGAAIAADARARERRGDRAGSLDALARLRRAAGRDDDLRALVDRLERRVRYRGVAGGR